MTGRAPGRIFDGYRLVRLLGRGGMGEVHLAHDTLLDRPVAIKFISWASADDEARRRFLLEGRAIARLQHPNVVQVYRVGELDTCPYLVSEFVRGEPLDRLSLPLDSAEALRIGHDIARGLAAAHRRGVVHRDIKPANAILSEDGEVKLLDFGIAKLMSDELGSDALGEAITSEPVEVAAVAPPAPARPAVQATGTGGAFDVTLTPARAEGAWDVTLTPALPPSTGRRPTTASLSAIMGPTASITRTGAALGTPAYMAPEVWAGEPATFRSDVYSFGALMYMLCSGRPPYQSSRGLADLAERVRAGGCAPLARVAPAVDPELARVVDRCLTLDPTGRYGSGEDLRSALQALLPGARADVIPEGNPYRGLYAFEAEHRDLFFGRDSEVRMLLERLASEPFALVAGDSGTGKSSLCRAGVLPRLGAWLDDGRRWTTATVVPGRHPVAALAAELARRLDDDEASLAETLATDACGFVRRLREKLGDARGLVLFVDQLEELVTLAEPEEAEAVAEALAWLAQAGVGLRLLATVRGDFLARVAALPHLGDEASRSLFFLRPLTAERVTEVIVGPARAKGVAFESPALVETLVRSTMQAEGGLPLLQFALAELWSTLPADARTITADALERIGGVAGALSRHADRVLADLTPAVRAAAREALRLLVSGAGTRARRTADELGMAQPATRAAVDALVRGRLVVARDAPEGACYEIAHEALIDGWQTLAGWLAEDADARAVRERLQRAVAEWAALGQAPEALWTGRRLDEARALDEGALPDRERAFLTASRRALRRARRRRLLLIAAAPLVALSLYAAVAMKHHAEVQRRIAAELSAAEEALAEADDRHRIADDLRTAALTRFDAPDVPAAEPLWADALAAAEAVRPLHARAARHLETALQLQPERRDARARFADLLYTSLLDAEARRDHGAQAELLERLAVYDDRGIRRARWDAPGRVTLALTPADAEVELFRYAARADEPPALEPVPLPGPLSDHALPQGSYLLIARARDRAEVREAFVVNRGEALTLRFELPPRDRVPEGFVYVPPGRFRFGSAAAEGLRRDFFHAVPLHDVTTPGYLVARHETTFGEWIDYLEALPEPERAERMPRVGNDGFQGALGLEALPDGRWRLTIKPRDRRYTLTGDEPLIYLDRTTHPRHDWRRLPVVGIAVADALAYTEWLHRTGRVPGARLCTEHEWERAARGADGREYPHGGPQLRPDDANHDATYGKRPETMGPDAVGSHPASRSPYGIDDLAGNVWEWTRSSLRTDEYPARGGSYSFGANTARAPGREITESSFRDASVGMRVCADAP